MRLNEVDTPVVVVDLPVTMQNLKRMQSRLDELGVGLRPHAKTHKSPDIVALQMELGAIGITVATVVEAETLFEAAGRDVFVANEVVSPSAVRRLFRLAQEGRVGLLVDSHEGLDVLEAEGRHWSKPIEVYLDMNITDPTGQRGRCGIPPGEKAIALAARIHESRYVKFQGILGYRGAPALFSPTKLDDPLAAAHRNGIEEGEILTRFAAELEAAGIPVASIAAGSTATALSAAQVNGVTEVHPGEYLFFGGIHAGPGVCDDKDCSAWVVATVISRPHPGRAVINAGKKVLHGDIQMDRLPNMGLKGHGMIYTIEGERLPGATLVSLAEEHGVLQLDDESQSLRVGDLVRVVPNHICPVINLTDSFLIYKDGQIVDEWPVIARGYKSMASSEKSA